MDPRLRRLLAGAAGALVVVALGTVPAPGASAGPAPERTLRPADLARGDGPGVPLVVGTTIVDGDVRVAVDAARVELLGTSDGDYLALVHPGGRPGVQRGRVERIDPDGRRTTVLPRVLGELTLSRDGTRLFETRVAERPRSVVRVLDPRSGAPMTRRAFTGYVRVLDADAGRAVLGATHPARTSLWDLAADRSRRLADAHGYLADLRADRFGTYTADVREGGCSELRKLSAPRTVLWTSCRQSVDAVSPDGRRVLARPLSLDGPVTALDVRTDTGRRVARYRTASWFGPSAWETRRSVVMTTYGRSRLALVRCPGTGNGACERASGLRRVP